MSDDSTISNSLSIGDVITRLVFPLLVGAVLFFIGRFTTPKPKLYYEATSPVQFASENEEVTIASLTVLNGSPDGVAIEGIRVELILPPDTAARDHRTETTGGATIPTRSLSSDNENDTVLVEIPALNSGESVTFTYLLDGTTTTPIQAHVRGEGVVGQIRPTQTTTFQSQDLLISLAAALFSIILAILLFPLLESIISRRAEARFEEEVLKQMRHLRNVRHD